MPIFFPKYGHVFFDSNYDWFLDTLIFKSDTKSRQQGSTFLFYRLHYVTSFRKRSRWIFNLPGTHQHIRLTKFTSRNILDIKINTKHTFLPIKHFINTDIQLSKAGRRSVLYRS